MNAAREEAAAMPIRPAWSIVALALALACPARAQERVVLPFGARVRLTWRDSAARYVGELRTVLGDTLVVADSAGAAEFLVPLARLRSVEVYQGRHAGWLMTVFCVAAGAAAGSWLGYHLWNPQAEREGDGFLDALIDLATESGPTATAILGGLLGAGILGALGAAEDHRERWTPVRPERLRVGAVPLRDGRLGIGVAIAF
jgi:hypothetical protein